MAVSRRRSCSFSPGCDSSAPPQLARRAAAQGGGLGYHRAVYRPGPPYPSATPGLSVGPKRMRKRKLAPGRTASHSKQFIPLVSDAKNRSVARPNREGSGAAAKGQRGPNQCRRRSPEAQHLSRPCRSPAGKITPPKQAEASLLGCNMPDRPLPIRPNAIKSKLPAAHNWTDQQGALNN